MDKDVDVHARFLDPKMGDKFSILGASITPMIGTIDYLTVVALTKDFVAYRLEPFQGPSRTVSISRKDLPKIRVLEFNP